MNGEKHTFIEKENEKYKKNTAKGSDLERIKRRNVMNRIIAPEM